MENIKIDTQEPFTVKSKQKGKLWDEPFKFAYKLTFVILIGFFVTYGFINGLVSSYLALNKLNKFIENNSEISTIKDILDVFNKLADSDKDKFINEGWIFKFKDGDDYKYELNTLFSFVNKNDKFQAIFSPGEFIIYYFSYFTILSNILTIVWMAYALFKPEHEGNKGLLNLKGATITATYITITSIIFNTALLPAIVIATGTFLGNKPMAIIEQEFVHTIGPIAFVVYICVFVKYKDLENVDNKLMYKTWGYAIAGLVGYGTYAIVRGILKYFGGAAVNDPYSWPYFFTQVLEKESFFFGLPGWVVFFFFILIIAGIFIGFHTIFWKTITVWKNKKTRI